MKTNKSAGFDEISFNVLKKGFGERINQIKHIVAQYFPRKNDISKNNPDIEYSYLTIVQSVNVSRKS